MNGRRLRPAGPREPASSRRRRVENYRETRELGSVSGRPKERHSGRDVDHNM